jgi:hypothetical protein
MRLKAKLAKAALKTLAAQQNKSQVIFDLMIFKLGRPIGLPFFMAWGID